MNAAVGLRPHPFDLVFGGCREARFPAIRAELAEASDVHAFLFAGPALELMREFRPDSVLGEDVDDFAALVHAAYLFWRDGERTITLDEPATREICRAAAESPRPDPRLPAITQYIQIAPRLVWGQLAADEPFEPLDGWFATPHDSGMRVVACFGVHPERPGVSIACVEGSIPRWTERPDGSALFAPMMPGGDAAHLHAVTTPDELLLLGWRASAGTEVARWP